MVGVLERLSNGGVNVDKQVSLTGVVLIVQVDLSLDELGEGVPDTPKDHVHHKLLGQMDDLLLDGQVAEEIRVLLPRPLQQEGRGQGLILRASLKGHEVAVQSLLLP